MAVHYVVQLDVDAETQAVLDDLDEQLASIAQVETTRRLGSNHHISLAIYDHLPVGFETSLEEYAARLRPVSVQLASIGVFPGAGVLFLAPVVDRTLAEVHRAFHQAFAAADAACWPYYRPDAWVPHATLAMRMPTEATARALTLVAEITLPRLASLDGLRLIEAFPVRTRALHRLSLA